MDGYETFWSKRFENERKATAVYQERAVLLEGELALTRQSLREANALIAKVSILNLYIRILLLVLLIL